MKLDKHQQRIVKAIVGGAQYEKTMDVVYATIGHNVYEYVAVERLIDIIRVMANPNRGENEK
jgi:hypothetical protein